jgi:hypothetical protein
MKTCRVFRNNFDGCYEQWFVVCVSGANGQMKFMPARVIPSRSGVTNSNQTPLSSERDSHLKSSKSIGKNKYMVLRPNWTRNKDVLRWQGTGNRGIILNAED